MPRKKKGSARTIGWLEEPEEHNYPAARSYLNLVMDPAAARKAVRKLRAATVSHFKAKDIFRASSLSLLGISNSHVEKDRRKIARGKALSPILLVRQSGKVVIERPKSWVILSHGCSLLPAAPDVTSASLCPLCSAAYSLAMLELITGEVRP